MKHLILDIESTNLVLNSLQPLSKQPRVIEIFGLMLNDSLKETGTFHSYVNPGVPIPPKVTEITGLKDEDVASAPKFEEIAEKFQKFVKKADVLVAHNLSHDVAIIDFEFKRLGQKFIWPRRRTCTVEATEHLKGHRLNLSALHIELFGKGFEKAHSAEGDVRATARCYVELLKRGEL